MIDNINVPVRQIKARVEVFEASTLLHTFNRNDRLISFTIERLCEEGLFFGFGICQSVNIEVIDMNREIAVSAGNIVKISYEVNGEWVYPHPPFKVTQSRRDENTNQLTIYGYDVIFDSSKRTVSELEVAVPYTVLEFAESCASLIGASGMAVQRLKDGEQCFDTLYIEGANFEGSESVRDALNDIAEATQTMYFIDADNRLIFKRLDNDIEADYTITKSEYFSLDNGDTRRLQTIASVTELGDNISASTSAIGSTQYVKDNAFWDLREDRDFLVDNAVAAIGNLSINQFECEWRGNFYLSLGDKIGLEGKEATLYSFLLNDKIEYNGGFAETTQWEFDDNSTESESNSTPLGDTLKQTFAKVDKVNKQIELVVSEQGELSESLAQIKLQNGEISASVTDIQQNIEDTNEAINDSIETLTQKVNASMSAENIKLEIQKELANGVSKVETTTGFTFDETGLTIEKDGSEIKTQITEDGMKVYKDSEEVLVANNKGVVATDLHAKTYLIIGTHSRFEDYGDRTGCFWIS